MAKEHREERAKVNIFFAQIEGGNDTIQDGLRTLAAALGRVTQPPPIVRQVRPSLPASNKAEDATRQRTMFDDPDPSGDVEEQIVLEALDTEELEEQAPARSKTTRPRKPSSYNVLGNLNLRPANKQSLKDFFAEKRPTDQNSQVTLFVYYLNRIANEPNIGYHHLYTCFQHIGKKVPLDLRSVVRFAAKKGWIDATNSKALRPTTSGENYVVHDLPIPAKSSR